jgi:hypothetical protein
MQCLQELDRSLTTEDKPELKITVVGNGKDEKMGRKIELTMPRKDTKQSLAALAWAANRRGRNAWRSDDVFKEITTYLDKNHVSYTRSNLQRVMRVLADEGYVDRRVDQRKHKTTYFAFHKDVDLTGYAPAMVADNSPDPDIVAEANGHPEDTAMTDTTTSAVTDAALPAKMPKGAMPPTPGDLEVPDMDSLTRLLKGWFKLDPDAYREWASATIHWLDARV